MPFNITQGSTVEFTVSFLDATGNITVPSSATLTVTYTTFAGSTAATVIPMTPIGSFFTANWGSGASAYGIANYSIAAPGQASPTTGVLRLLDP